MVQFSRRQGFGLPTPDLKVRFARGVINIFPKLADPMSQVGFVSWKKKLNISIGVMVIVKSSLPSNQNYFWRNRNINFFDQLYKTRVTK